jgi:folate-binding protein YgfZ
MIPDSAFCGRLPARGVVQVAGATAERFLQGLVTADVPLVPRPPSAHYAAFLNGRGRVEFDAIVTRNPGTESAFLLDVARSRAPALVQHLLRYRLRAAVEVRDVSDDWHVWACCGVPAGKVGAAAVDLSDARENSAGISAAGQDPRAPDLGLRALVPVRGGDAVAPAEHLVHRLRDVGVEVEVLEPDRMHTCYDAWRTALGVPEGDDFVGNPLPLEMAIDSMHGIAFDKGCYLGQELTARTHYTGTIRKRITPFIRGVGVDDDAQAGADRLCEMFRKYAAVRDMHGFTRTIVRLGTREGGSNIAHGDNLFLPGRSKPVGTVTSAVGNVGLAMLRLEEAFGPFQRGQSSACSGIRNVGKPLNLADGSVAIPWKPLWWPDETDRPPS